MRFWISHASDVPIREQLVTQIVLAILSEDLQTGVRLPSTRELARRFRIHANTVSAAYKDLERAGWLELRHGSGVYIRRQYQQESLSPELVLDRQIAGLFSFARQSGIAFTVVRRRLRHWLDLQPPDHFLLIEPDAELATIVTAEIRQAVAFPVVASDFKACTSPELLESAIPLAMPSKVERVRARLPQGMECIGLRVRSVTESLASWMPPNGCSRTMDLRGPASARLSTPRRSTLLRFIIIFILRYRSFTKRWQFFPLRRAVRTSRLLKA